MTAEIRNRSGEQGFESLALANLARDLFRYALVGLAFHVTQRLPHSLVREEVQEGGLLQLHGQRRLQRAVKDSIARRVYEIRQQDRVLVGQRRPTVEVKEGSDGRQGYDGQCDHRAALVVFDLTDN